jgi:hypothetical protein
MAACDNLYGNEEQWEELHSFLSEKKPEYLKYMLKKPGVSDGEVRICYVADIQEWLFENCKAEWIQDALKENFHIQRIILGKSHHE